MEVGGMNLIGVGIGNCCMEENAEDAQRKRESVSSVYGRGSETKEGKKH